MWTRSLPPEHGCCAQLAMFMFACSECAEYCTREEEEKEEVVEREGNGDYLRATRLIEGKG